MKEDTTPIDFEFLCRMASLKEALTISASDPVSVTVGTGLLGTMFYDCLESEKRGLGIMQTRIGLASDDIIEHQKIHEKILKNFYDLEEAINTNSRARVFNAAFSILTGTKKYASLVQTHVDRLGTQSFLKYPSCPLGHYFSLPFQNKLYQLEFNPLGSMIGCSADIGGLQDALYDFRAGKNKIPSCSLSVSKDIGEGIMDSSLRGRIELNKTLLQKAGFSLEGISE